MSRYHLRVTIALAVMTTAVVLASATAVVVPGRADAAVVTSNEAIVQPGTLTPLHGGGSATPYGVVLPAGASCPGDTAHDQYRVYSYLIPTGVALTSVSFKGFLPRSYYGFIAYGAYFGAVNTAEGTGQIVGIPDSFVFIRLTPSELFSSDTTSSATWEGGIACVNRDGVATDAWNTQFRFTRDSKDPGGFRWTVENPASVSAAGGTPWLWIGGGLVALSVLSAVVLLILLRRDPSETDTRGDEGSGGGPPVDGDGTLPSGGPSADAKLPDADDHGSYDAAGASVSARVSAGAGANDTSVDEPSEPEPEPDPVPTPAR
jgi:hypothetical protein